MSTDDRDSELDALRRRLAEAEEALDAIYDGAVDALVVRGPDGPQIFTLRGAQEPYRELVERMNEGALTVSADGTILYSNRHFADLVGQPLDLIIGKPLVDFAADCDAHLIAPLLQAGLDRSIRRELALQRDVPTVDARNLELINGIERGNGYGRRERCCEWPRGHLAPPERRLLRLSRCRAWSRRPSQGPATVRGGAARSAPWRFR